jgi:hypothetical protein
VVELAAKLGDLSAKTRVVAKPRTLERLDNAESRGLFRLCKHSVEADDKDAVFVEQLIDEPRHLLPAPGPAPLLGKALLVDLYDDDPLVDGVRHGKYEARVVGNVFQPRHQIPIEDLDDMRGKNRQNAKAQEDPQALSHDEVFQFRR